MSEFRFEGKVETGLEGSRPLTWAQESIWLDQALQPNESIYNVGGIVHVDAALDLRRLDDVISRLVDEEEALRCVIRWTDAGFQQVGCQSARAEVLHRSFKDDPPPRASAMAWLEGQFWRPIDLVRGPLFMFAVAEVSDAETLLLVRGHHVIADFEAIQLIIKRLSAYYGDRPTPKIEIGADTLAQAEHDYAASAKFDADRNYWSERLEGATLGLLRQENRGRQTAETRISGRTWR